MNSPEVKAFIQDQSNLFWYTPADQKENISEEFLVETIMNYGDLDATKRLIALLGFKRLSEVFYSLQGRKSLNYYPEIYNFLSLIIEKYEHSDI